MVSAIVLVTLRIDDSPLNVELLVQVVDDLLDIERLRDFVTAKRQLVLLVTRHELREAIVEAYESTAEVLATVGLKLVVDNGLLELKRQIIVQGNTFCCRLRLTVALPERF